MSKKNRITKISTKIGIILDVIIEMNNNLHSDKLHSFDIEQLRERATQCVATDRQMSAIVIRDKYTTQLALTQEQFSNLVLSWFREESNELREILLQHATKIDDKDYINLILSHE